jgi:hypothetical protein
VEHCWNTDSKKLKYWLAILCLYHFIHQKPRMDSHGTELGLQLTAWGLAWAWFFNDVLSGIDSEFFSGMINEYWISLVWSSIEQNLLGWTLNTSTTAYHMIVTFSCIVRFQLANSRLLLQTSNVTFWFWRPSRTSSKAQCLLGHDSIKGQSWIMPAEVPINSYTENVCVLPAALIIHSWMTALT